MSGLPTNRSQYSYAGCMTLFDLLTQTAIADTELLRKNDESGDAFAAPREVDFAFESAKRENAEDFASFVNGKQYGVAKVTELEDGRLVSRFSSPCQSLNT